MFSLTHLELLYIVLRRDMFDFCTDLCGKHRCPLFRDNLRCLESKTEWSRFCPLHTCPVELCNELKHEENQFCAEHQCFACLERNPVRNSSIDYKNCRFENCFDFSSIKSKLKMAKGLVLITHFAVTWDVKSL